MLQEASNGALWNVLRGRFAAPQDEGTSFWVRFSAQAPATGVFRMRRRTRLRILLARYGLMLGASTDASALLQEPLTSPKCVCTQDAMRSPPDMTLPQKCLTSASHSVAR